MATSKKTFAKWRHDAHLHRDLMMLSDRCLEDIGITRRWTADDRSTKPFWLPYAEAKCEKQPIWNRRL
jgi:uncharacterized protein YjiS (DUF1127 family)